MLEMQAQSSKPEICLSILGAVQELAEKFKQKYHRLPVFMEVCGSHTMALAKSGVKQALKEQVKLISGPGCPVCVTDQASIDSMIALAGEENRIICTFGDMMRVPGSERSLMDEKTAGKDIRVLYSPIEAITIAEENPDKEIIFLGIGFETTIPILALLIREAERKNLVNFSMWMTTKLIEPILRYLLDAGEVQLDGFILPGHVSIVLGEESYQYLSSEYSISGCITGFEPAQLLSGIYKLIELAYEQKKAVINDHPAVVTQKGNQTAQHLMTHYFHECDEAWRGIGIIPASGLDLKPEFSRFNAKKKYHIETPAPKKTKCRCGEVIRGLTSPSDCPLFSKACHPLKPIGPCMVSSEGSCSAYYQYMRESL
ncbi:hydrogenase formation protein HypD [Bacillus benzoevorans]|uniref:Hydrogenase expression/formation protein HypD n=1 Tax=Bacillus benzoevorans TaxID=1456 RepID=A0A7X0HRQ0_9BACI|nr:hydrogenase formation protein HypD [Bacillus benzoevorans]MBB6444587.1 hydrogenase expression/formation protein HypD [Bacillus benzoevorans]